MRILKVGFAGFGPGGQVYNAPILSSVQGFDIHKILTSNKENIRAARQHFPNAQIVGDYGELIADPDIDLLVITAPNHLHYDLSRKALNAGKHVVVEKPFTTSVEEAEELISLALQKQRVLSVNHNRRWDSDIRTVKKVIDQGILGQVMEFQAHFDRFRSEIKDSWKEQKELPGSGILYDLGSHLIDQALMLFGSPKEVFAHLSTQREKAEVVDNFELLLLYPNLKVTLKAGMLVKAPGPRYTVLGRNASFIKHGMDVQEADLKAGKLPKNTPDWGKEPENIWGSLYIGDEKQVVQSETGDYRKFYRNIYDAIVHQIPLEVTPEQAKTVIEIIQLAIKSHQEKRILPLK